MSGRNRPTRKRRADLSQHFLREAHATRLLQATSISRADFVIEIGPGRGALTKPLIQRAGRLLAVELDPYLAKKLQRDVGNRAHIVATDFLDYALPDGVYSIIGNVPFSITTAIIRKLTDACNPPADAWLIVQRELAHRLCGHPFSSETLWSLRLKPHWHIEIIQRLKKTDFDPPPGVDSVFLRISNRGRPLLSDQEFLLYLKLIEAAFRSGGTLTRVMHPWLSKVQLRRLAADLLFKIDEKPKTLAFEHWLGLLRYIHGSPTRPPE